jgi:hypothetical protein
MPTTRKKNEVSNLYKNRADISQLNAETHFCDPYILGLVSKKSGDVGYFFKFN